MSEKKCEHYWNYIHSLWAGRDGYDEVSVGRYCPKCKTMQTATAGNWHRLPKSQVDMRETMEEVMIQ